MRFCAIFLTVASLCISSGNLSSLAVGSSSGSGKSSLTTVVGCKNDSSIQMSNGLATLEQEMETSVIKCKLWHLKKSTIIALGNVYKTDGKQMLHNKELLKDCYKVPIDTSLVDAVCIHLKPKAYDETKHALDITIRVTNVISVINLRVSFYAINARRLPLALLVCTLVRPPIILSIEDKLNYLEHLIPAAPFPARAGQQVAPDALTTHAAWRLRGSNKLKPGALCGQCAVLRDGIFETDLSSSNTNDSSVSNLLARDRLLDVKDAFAVVSREESHRGLAPGKTSAKSNHALLLKLKMYLKLGKIVRTGSESGGLYMFDYDHNGKAFTDMSNSSIASYVFKELWHCRLGHLADQVLSVLSVKIGFKTGDHNFAYDICHKAKQTREPFPLSDQKSFKIVLKVLMMKRRTLLLMAILEQHEGVVPLATQVKDNVTSEGNSPKFSIGGGFVLRDVSHIEFRRKTIGSKWIYRIKCKASGEIDRYKARLVAQEFGQKEGLDYEETFSRIVKMVTIRCLIGLLISKNWPLFQLDVNNAFLYGDLDDEVYMALPPGFMIKMKLWFANRLSPYMV
uniref:Ribonuclease H-like domain-containing protein n=1 Tax=Tanacetum cinerariifolium TaxID=118510 RepID=A0A6L2LIP3_TANCI|nr:ribonuclease H-like domain-containing protein [Tanacetum cinerariifolium]